MGVAGCGLLAGDLLAAIAIGGCNRNSCFKRPHVALGAYISATEELHTDSVPAKGADTMSEPTVLADIAIYDCPEGNLDAVAHMLIETGFSLTSIGGNGVPVRDERLVPGRRYYCDEFRSGDEIFERLADRGVVGLFWNSADYLWSPTLVYIARGEWRKLPSEIFKLVPLVPAILVEAALQDGSLDAFAQLDEAMGGGVRRIVEMAAVACGDREVAAFVRGVGLSDDIAPASRSGLRVRF